MSNFKCHICGTDIIDSPKGYITECEHYPLEKPVIKVCNPEEEMNMPESSDWLKKCHERYFELTGTSPNMSFWAFVDACGVEPSMEGFKEFYEELPSYFSDSKEARNE